MPADVLGLRVENVAPPLAPLDAAISQAFCAYLNAGADPEAEINRDFDSGPPALAEVWQARAASAGLAFDPAPVVTSWLDRAPDTAGHYSVFGGIGALVHGLASAARCCVEMKAFHERILAGLLHAVTAENIWSNPARDWPDYDLAMGPAGLMLVLCADELADPSSLDPIASHLIGLVSSREMSGFRLSGCIEDERRRWNSRAINLGLAHGVPGPIAALTAYVRRGGGLAADAADAIAIAGEWLVSQAHEDERGIITWSPQCLDRLKRPSRPSDREAWCYGAPGIAWILWDAGEAIGNDGFALIALDAFERYERAFDIEFHLNGDAGDQLAICHGAAGIMQIADAFERYAALPSASRLADRLEQYLLTRLTDIVELARANPSLLGGGMGILATLLVRLGSDRRWLSILALR